MDAFLFGVGLLSAIAFDMGRAFLTFGAAVRALGDGAALLGDKEELTVWNVYEKKTLYTRIEAHRLTGMGAAADTVTL